MSSIKLIEEFMGSEDFIQNYHGYLHKKDSTLQVFLDNIDLNKK